VTTSDLTPDCVAVVQVYGTGDCEWPGVDPHDTWPYMLCRSYGHVS